MTAKCEKMSASLTAKKCKHKQLSTSFAYQIVFKCLINNES